MQKLILTLLLGTALAACAPERDEAPAAPEPAPEITEPSVPEEDPDMEEAKPELTLLDEVTGAYGIAWNVDEGWPGEYPNGFSIEAEGGVIPARSLPMISQPHDLSCPLDKGVTIHQWNHDRVEEDDLRFFVANEIYIHDVIADGSITAWPLDDLETEMTLEFTPGDTIAETRYYGEGYGEIMVDGRRYQTDLQALFDFVSEPNNTDEEVSEEHLWALITCDDADATRAWVLHAEALKVPGVIETPMTEYGMSYDLK